MEFLSFSPTPSVNDTKKHRLPVEKPSLSAAHKQPYQRRTELRSAECWKRQFIRLSPASQIVGMTRKWKTYENMSAGLGKRGRAEAVTPPFLSPEAKIWALDWENGESSPVSSHFRVHAFSILETRLSRSEPPRSLEHCEQARGVTE